ncbi:MAG: hypothetical protein FWG56_05160 [Desulfovibrionaceae bacterium]|nr:hypothetical protein [Desulfovibrionaceae bacterium]
MKFLQFFYYVTAICSFCAGITAIIIYGGDDGQGSWIFLLCMAVAAIFLGLAQRQIKDT